MRVDEHGIRDTATLRNAFATLDRDRPHALYVVTDQRMVAYREIISAEAIRLRLPTASNYQGFADAGGLLAYSADLAEIYRRGAAYVARILDGAKPGELPVEQPTRLELVLNLKTAKSIGIKVPQSILLRADRVIQG
jgi:putative ABC transport system substrate-binding protein